MPLHPELTTAFHKGLFDGVVPQGVTAQAPSETEQRFAVYRNNVAHSLIQALRSRFPTIEALVGAEFFAAMAQVFIENNPPRSPVMQDYGAGFPGFLRRFPPVRDYPYLPDVARLERLRGLAYHAADATALDHAALSKVIVAGGRLTLHPSLYLFDAQTAAVSIWRAHHGGPKVTNTAAPEQALIARDLDLSVIVVPLDPASAAFCKDLVQGSALSAALARAQMSFAGFDPNPTLALLVSSGLIVSEAA